MSREIDINISTNSDTKGIEQTKKALNEVKKTAEDHPQIKIDGWDEAIKKANELRDAINDVPRLEMADGLEGAFDIQNAREFDDVIVKAAKSLQELADAEMEALNVASQTGDTEAIQKHIDKLEEFKVVFDYLTSSKPMGHLDISPESGKIIDETEEGLQRLEEKYEELRNKMNNGEPVKAQWLIDQETAVAEMERLAQLAEEEDKLTENRKASGQAAKRAAEVHLAALKRQGMGVKELRAEYERYAQTLKEAHAQGDKDGMQTTVAHMRVLKTEIKAAEVQAKRAENALNRLPKPIDKVGKAATKSAYMIQAMQGGVRGLVHNIPGLVMALGGGMGLAGALALATSAGMTLHNKLTEGSKKAKEQLKKDADEIGKAYENLRKDYNLSLSTKEYADAYKSALEHNKSITGELKLQSEILKEQLRIRLESYDAESGIYDVEAQTRRHDVNRRFYDGEINERQREIELEEIDLKSNEWRRQQRLRKQEAVFKASEQDERNAKEMAKIAQEDHKKYQSSDAMTPLEYSEVDTEIARNKKLAQDLKEQNDRIEEKIKEYSSQGVVGYKYQGKIKELREAQEKNLEEISQFEKDIFEYKKIIETSDKAIQQKSGGKINMSGDMSIKLKGAETYHKIEEEKAKAAQEAAIKAVDAEMARKGAGWKLEDESNLVKAERERDKGSRSESSSRRKKEDQEKYGKELQESTSWLGEEIKNAAQKATNDMKEARETIKKSLSDANSDNPQWQKHIDHAVDYLNKALDDNSYDSGTMKMVDTLLRKFNSFPNSSEEKYKMLNALNTYKDKFAPNADKSDRLEDGQKRFTQEMERARKASDVDTFVHIVEGAMDQVKELRTENEQIRKAFSDMKAQLIKKKYPEQEDNRRAYQAEADASLSSIQGAADRMPDGSEFSFLKEMADTMRIIAEKAGGQVEVVSSLQECYTSLYDESMSLNRRMVRIEATQRQLDSFTKNRKW